MKASILNLRVLFLGLFVAAGVFSMSSCEEVITEITFPVVVNNNTSDDLTIFESVDDSDFFSIGEVPAGFSVKEKGFIVDADYVLEARNDNGDVIATTTFNQPENNERTWTIN
jgi:hypothetical protein